MKRTGTSISDRSPPTPEIHPPPATRRPTPTSSNPSVSMPPSFSLLIRPPQDFPVESLCFFIRYIIFFWFLAGQEDLRYRQRRGIRGAGGAGVPTNQQALPTMRFGSAAVTDIQWGSFAGGCWLGRLSSILGTSETLVI